MIVKGNTHGDGGKLADYLTKGGPGERAELFDMRGFRTGDIHAAFSDIEFHKLDTKAEAALFHVQMRSADGELQKLSRSQLLEIVDGCDLALGRAMTHQPRAASLHIDSKTGDFHIHVAYDLIRQTEDGRAFVQRLGKYENKLQLYAREVELKYGLQILSNEPRPGARRAERNELEESRRLGTDIHAIRSAILDGFQKSDNGRSFQAAMKEQGMQVAAGDRRDCFVVIDPAGGQHALNKKLTGLTLKDINARLSDLDKSQLPSVDQAKQMQRDRAAREGQEREKHGRAADAPGQQKGPSHGPQRSPQPEIKPLGQTAGEIRLAWHLTKTGDQFAQAIEDRGLILVHVSREEAAASYRAREYAKEIKHQNRALKEGFAVVDRRGSVYRIDQRTTGDLWEEIQKKLGGIDKRELLSVDQAREAMKDARKIEFAEKKRAEQQKARPATKLEQAIIAADKKAGRDDQLFAAELGEKGIALARVTANDIKALAALRADQDLATAIDEAPRRLNIFANVREGELCVVTKLGDVIPLNQQHMDALDNRTFPGSARSGSTELVPSSGDPKSILDVPSVTDARYSFALDADLLQEFWRSNTEARAIDRQAALDRRLAQSETAQAIDRQEAITGSLQDVKQDIIGVAENAVDTGTRAAAGLGEMFEKALTAALDWAADFIAPPPPPTREQIRQRQIAEAERQEIEARIIRPAAEQAARFREIEDEARERTRERERER
jgi:Relaxase/Mobilisation nuclease domain